MVAGPEGTAIEVIMRRGEVLLFDGDLVHAGAAYPECANTRIHLYIFAKGPRPRGQTYKVPSFQPSRVLVWDMVSREYREK